MHSGKCTGNEREMYGKCTGNVWEMYKECTRNVREMYRKCTGNVQEMYGKCTGNVQVMYGKFTGNLRWEMRRKYFPIINNVITSANNQLRHMRIYSVHCYDDDISSV